MSERDPELIRHTENVLRIAAAQIAGDSEAMSLALGKYIPEGFQEFQDAERLLATSLIVVVLLIIDLAKTTSVTPEALIDELLLELV